MRIGRLREPGITEEGKEGRTQARQACRGIAAARRGSEAALRRGQGPHRDSRRFRRSAARHGAVPLKLLLDTHAFLWFASGDRRLSRPARLALERDGAELYISAPSVWEMAIKAALGRLRLPAPVGTYVAGKVAGGYRMLPVTWPHAAGVEQLPLHHRDPFDRLLVAQARAEGYAVVTRDRVFRKYGVDVVW